MVVDSTTLVPMQGFSDLLGLLIPLAILVIIIAGIWKTFEKAGEPGWAALIPIYNAYVLIRISDNPWWWLLLFFIPVINIIAAAKISIDVAKQFDQGVGFGIGLWLLSFIFYPLLGFGDYQYQSDSPSPA